MKTIEWDDDHVDSAARRLGGRRRVVMNDGSKYGGSSLDGGCLITCC